MSTRVPPSFKHIGELLDPIMRRAAGYDPARVMAYLMVASGADLADDGRLLQMLIVQRLWAGTRQEVEEHFDKALDIARAIKDSEAYRNGNL